MSKTFIPFKTKKYLAIAREPVYVGTGGYRIGRVDNTIVRDPATNLPKIPGTTISGNARYFSWLSYKSEGMENIGLGCSKGNKTKDEEPCGICPICLTYGYTKEEGAQAGLAYFSDARILFFPVSTMIGTVWITSESIIKEYLDVGGDNIHIGNTEFFVSSSLESSLPEDNQGNKILNFGWVMLKKSGNINPENWKIKKDTKEDNVCDLRVIVEKIDKRICIVSNNVFPHIVNSNLETRTSVSIDPVTGAAKTGALFTFEALPRGTVFLMDITYENPENYFKQESIEKVIRTAEKGLELFSSIGIGGMGTRGFGKIEVLKDNWLDEKEYWERIKKFVEEILPEKIKELESKISNESDNNKKEKLKKGKEKLEKKKELWGKYVNMVISTLEQDCKNKEEILELLKSH